MDSPQLIGKYDGHIYNHKGVVTYGVIIEDAHELVKMKGIVLKISCMCKLHSSINSTIKIGNDATSTPLAFGQRVLVNTNFGTGQMSEIIKIYSYNEFLNLEKKRREKEIEENLSEIVDCIDNYTSHKMPKPD